MKIALIYPPFLRSIQTTLPEFVNDNEGVFHPLGILYIASYLKASRKDAELLIIDAASQKLSYEDIGKRVADFSADIVGISCWTFSLVDSLEVARQVKKVLPKARVCMGGPHATIYPRETVSFEEVDFVITGDGEKAFSMLVDALSDEAGLEGVPNLFYKKGSIIEKSSSEYSEKDLNALPFPDRSMLPKEDYYSIMDKGEFITTMITSRGCPFQCKFCFQQDTGWRYRSIDNIIAEMKACVNLGFKNFFIFDETFTVNKQRVMGLCDEIIRLGLNINWSCRSRVDTIDDEIMKRLKSAGCSRISFGVESASVKVLNRLNKNIKLSRVREVFKLAKANGLITLADFMVGCPDENRVIAYDTIDLAIKLNPDYVQFSLFTLFPATELYTEALKEGVVDRDVWLEYAMSPSPDFTPPLWNIYSEAEAKKILVDAYRKFYFRPSYILKKLSGISSIRELKYYSKAGLDLAMTALKGKKGAC